MKVKELILELQKCNQEDIVLVHGYEIGYCDVDKINTLFNLKFFNINSF